MKFMVKPSMRINEEPHHAWVAVDYDGTILTAHCICKAGLDETCSHVGALLFKVEYACRMGYTNKVCTDIPCRWNDDFVDDVQLFLMNQPCSKLIYILKI